MTTLQVDILRDLLRVDTEPADAALCPCGGAVDYSMVCNIDVHRTTRYRIDPPDDPHNFAGTPFTTDEIIRDADDLRARRRNFPPGRSDWLQEIAHAEEQIARAEADPPADPPGVGTLWGFVNAPPPQHPDEPAAYWVCPCGGAVAYDLATMQDRHLIARYRVDPPDSPHNGTTGVTAEEMLTGAAALLAARVTPGVTA